MIHVCQFVCVSLSMSVCVCLSLKCMYMPICMHACMYVCACPHTFIHVRMVVPCMDAHACCIPRWIDVCMCVYMDDGMPVCMGYCSHVYLHVWMTRCMRECMCVCAVCHNTFVREYTKSYASRRACMHAWVCACIRIRGMHVSINAFMCGWMYAVACMCL